MASPRARQCASDAGHRAAPNSDEPVCAVVAPAATTTTRRRLASRQCTDIVSLAWGHGFVLKGPSFRSIGDSVVVSAQLVPLYKCV